MATPEAVLAELQTKRKWLSSARNHLLAHRGLDNGDLFLVEVLERQLAQVDGALERLAAGTYGMCQVCGAPIAPERLEAISDASLCLACARRDEAVGQARRAPASRRAEEASEPTALTTAA